MMTALSHGMLHLDSHTCTLSFVLCPVCVTVGHRIKPYFTTYRVCGETVLQQSSSSFPHVITYWGF